jgi:hypothetical protein
MTEIHCLFPSNVGHIYIVKRGNLPHYLPDALMFAWAKIKLDFDVAHRVPITCTSLLQKNLQHISSSLQGGCKNRLNRVLTI